MATIQKRNGVNGKETYTVTIRLKGVNSQTATFDRLTDAKRWSASTESSIRKVSAPVVLSAVRKRPCRKASNSGL